MKYDISINTNLMFLKDDSDGGANPPDKHILTLRDTHNARYDVLDIETIFTVYSTKN